MSQAPRVSVLVPVYRHEHFVRAAIDSIYAQTWRDFEVIVIDDASPDNSVAVVEKLQQQYGFTFLRNQPNQGVVRTFNRGLAAARGEYIALLAGDDIWLPGKLAEQVAWMDAHPEAAACSGNIIRIDAQGQPLEKKPSLRAAADVSFEEFLSSRFYFPAPVVLLRRRALDDVQAFDERFSYEDWPLWLSLSHKGWRLHRLHSVLGHYRIHGENLHKRIATMEEQNYRILAQYREHPRYRRSLKAMQLGYFESALEISSAEAWPRARSAVQLKWRYVRGLLRLAALKLRGR